MKRSPFFLGAHELILDPKSRLSIPTLLRKNFDSADNGSLFVTIRNATPWLYPLGHFRRLIRRQLPPGLTPSDLQEMYSYLTLSLGAEVEVDAQGRIVLPDSILHRVDLGREITLVGVNDHMEIFSRARWNEMRNKVIAQSEVLEMWAKESLLKAVSQEGPSAQQPAVR